MRSSITSKALAPTKPPFAEQKKKTDLRRSIGCFFKGAP